MSRQQHPGMNIIVRDQLGGTGNERDHGTFYGHRFANSFLKGGVGLLW
jgi:hypothetical protein